MNMKIGVIIIFIGIISVIIFNDRNYQQQKEKNPQAKSYSKGKKQNNQVVKQVKKERPRRKKILRQKRNVSGRASRKQRRKNILQKVGSIKKITIGKNQSLSYFPNRFASISKIPGRKLITTYRRFYIYESTPQELENVFVNSKTNNVEIWTGEIIIKSELDIRELLSSYSNLEYLTRINDLHVIKVFENSSVFESINEISQLDGIIKIEFDLQKSRKERI